MEMLSDVGSTPTISTITNTKKNSCQFRPEFFLHMETGGYPKIRFLHGDDLVLEKGHSALKTGCGYPKMAILPKKDNSRSKENRRR